MNPLSPHRSYLVRVLPLTVLAGSSAPCPTSWTPSPSCTTPPPLASSPLSRNSCPPRGLRFQGFGFLKIVNFISISLLQRPIRSDASPQGWYRLKFWVKRRQLAKLPDNVDKIFSGRPVLSAEAGQTYIGEVSAHDQGLIKSRRSGFKRLVRPKTKRGGHLSTMLQPSMTAASSTGFCIKVFSTRSEPNVPPGIS